LKLLFSLFDTDHDGRITQDEIKQLVETVSGHLWTEEQLAAFMQIVDTDSKYNLISFY
jgi:Ca2+-binding EF-hand superfamily protein